LNEVLRWYKRPGLKRAAGCSHPPLLAANRRTGRPFVKGDAVRAKKTSAHTGASKRAVTSRETNPLTPPLPPRLHRTLTHLLAPGTEKQIAEQMGVSANTLHGYVKDLYRRLGVRSRMELVARWIDAGRSE
jgi:DNA-binding NarL/FixJ family response regulator